MQSETDGQKIPRPSAPRLGAPPFPKGESARHAEREEEILAFWKEKGIFEKTLEKNEKSGKEFIFYEGPPTANGRPGIHHLEARAFKDAIPRYKTMRGFHVRRKGGWDTHGLPVELQVEKELSLKSKKEIEQYGIAPFNDKCKESVWKYVHEWEAFTDRMGYWVDLENPYITYKPQYIESVWNIIKTVDDKGLLYKDYKVVPWCPRCGTALSSHELAQGYEDVKDLAVYVRFELEDSPGTYMLAWTTTPWTLPGNIGLAVAADVMYVEAFNKETGDRIILSKRGYANLSDKATGYEVVKKMKGHELVGRSYKSLYPFLKENITGVEKEKLGNAFKVYAADFVTTEDGTGIVHTAVMYGQDDFELGTKVGLPKFHLVNDDGTFKKEAGFLAGKFVKDEATDVEIVKDLANRPGGSLLFAKEKYQHSYPHCWRCHTPLIYFARDSWYIKMSKLRDELVKENESIHWEPEHIKEGRFGEWLREVKDWAISRERYWGTPLPVWICEKCGERKVVGSIAEIAKKPKNTYWVMRHGEAENNVAGILSNDPDAPHHLTDKGKNQVKETAKSLAKTRFDMIFVSPFVRTKETVEILKTELGLEDSQIIVDERIRELKSGVWSGKNVSDFVSEFKHGERFERGPEGGENYADIKRRMGDFLFDLENKHSNKTILIVTHETPAFLLVAAALGWDRKQALDLRGEKDFMGNAESKHIEFDVLPHNDEYELDLHRPRIDEIKLECKCGGDMKRAKEVMDVWFDSGAMPFAQDHYLWGKSAASPENPPPLPAVEVPPFSKGESARQDMAYPADFISEAIDQTRGWFYTLHAIGILMGKGKAYKNVICLGHILDAKGAKMSKHIGNVVDPFMAMDKYGADALRFWMYSVNQPGDSKNFDEKTVDEVVKKVFNLTGNVLAFYKLYASDESKNEKVKSKTTDKKIVKESQNILDGWIVSRLNQLVVTVTEGLDDYKFFEPARVVREFVADLSQWYLRRSRDRFKTEGEDKEAAIATMKYVLTTLAKVMAPMTPFFAEFLYREVGGELESVHLEDWPEGGEVDLQLIGDMEKVRAIASLGLEARMKAGMIVRQPLLELKVKGERLKLGDERLVGLVKDEVNVKEVVFEKSPASQENPPPLPVVGAPPFPKGESARFAEANGEFSVELDTTITPELKEEGELRELMRKIQDMRKEKGLSVGDRAKLTVTAELKDLTDKYGNELKKATGLEGIVVGDSFDLF